MDIEDEVVPEQNRKYYHRAAARIKYDFNAMAKAIEEDGRREKEEWGRRSRSRSDRDEEVNVSSGAKGKKDDKGTKGHDFDDLKQKKESSRVDEGRSPSNQGRKSCKDKGPEESEPKERCPQGQRHHHGHDKDTSNEPKVKRRGLSPRNAIRVDSKSPDSPGTPYTPIDESLPKNNYDSYGPTFYNNNVNPELDLTNGKGAKGGAPEEEDEGDDKIPLKRDVHLCRLIDNSSFSGQVAIANAKKGVTNIQDGDPNMAKDTLTLVSRQLELIRETQTAILSDIKGEIDTLQAENLYLFQANEKLKSQNTHLLERTVDLTKDLERMKRYVRVKQLEWEKSTTPRSKCSKGKAKKKRSSREEEDDEDGHDDRRRSKSKPKKDKSSSTCFSSIFGGKKNKDKLKKKSKAPTKRREEDQDIDFEED